MAELTIDQLATDTEFQLRLTLRAGRTGMARRISVPRIQKPGLALTGYAEQLHTDRLLTLGQTEIEYLMKVAPEARKLGIDTVIAASPACVVVTRGLTPPPELVSACDEQGVPLLVTELVSAEFISRVIRFLQEHLAPTESVHGVLIEVLGVGILLLGKSGIGKSEAALDLVMRGHRLIADDIVHIRRFGKSLLYGSGAGLIRHHLEVRGLGIINIKDLFGISAVRQRKRISLVLELSEWSEGAEYDRLGLDARSFTVLGEDLPMLTLPVRPGRNVASLIEVAARNQLLKLMGHNSALELQRKLNQAIADGTRRPAEEAERR